MADRAPVHLVQFTREPVPGRVKTRMLPALRPEQACELHCELTLHTLRTLCASELGGVELCVAGAADHPFFKRCQAAGAVALTTQEGGDLGARMYAALARGLAQARKVILVGSDCPGIDVAYLRAAEAALDAHDVVLGPALDGGYVLIGARALRREWFLDIEWGTASVYAATVGALGRSGSTHAALAPLADIDRPEDLEWWRSLRGKGPPEPAGSGAERG